MRTTLVWERRRFIDWISFQLFVAVRAGIKSRCHGDGFDTGIILKAFERNSGHGIFSQVSLTVYTLTGLVWG